jgi:hypothetical protein
MHITIEDNKVIVNLDADEFPKFEAMFENLELNKVVRCDFRKFNFPDFETKRDILLMHLCRTIGEANLSENPFATMSIYPFWKYGFAFGGAGKLVLNLEIDDPHKKAVAADEFGMGFCAWAMEEVFKCEYWADASSLIAEGLVVPTGSRRPDFVCTFPDGSLGIFEAKGTTGTAGNLALSQGKLQTQAITAPDPISQRVVVGCALGGATAEIVLLDPPPGDAEKAEPTNLTADLVRKAAMKMRTLRPSGTSLEKGGEDLIPLTKGDHGGSAIDAPLIKGGQGGSAITIFRGPDSTTGTTREIALTHDDYKEGKGHGWLEIEA